MLTDLVLWAVYALVSALAQASICFRQCEMVAGVCVCVPKVSETDLSSCCTQDVLCVSDILSVCEPCVKIYF